jgi:NAD-dependent SIR2 family protein deacetylase
VSDRTVVFLGAGASVPHGYPTTEGILPRMWADLADGSWRRWAGLRGKSKARERVGELRKLIAALLPGVTGRRGVPGGTSIVDLVSLVDQLAAEGRSPIPSMSEAGLVRARGMLQLGINAALRGSRQLALRDELVRWLLGRATRRADSRLTLISTNYDTLVEKRVFDHFIGLRAPIGKHVDFGIPWRDAFRDELHVRPQGARLAILKLHGSLNWVRCEVCGHVTINVRGRIASLEFWTKTVSYNQCYCEGRLRSVVVTPSYVRDVRDANLLSIWNAAVEDLRRANEWVLIGYSMPSEDIAIRSLLLRAFHTRTQRRGLRIRVVQWEPPDAARAAESPVRKRYEAFFPPAHLRRADYSTRGVEDFVRGQRAPGAAEIARRLKREFSRRP